MKAENGHRVSVHYRGTLIDGTEFDNSRTRGETLNFDLGSGTMIQGFNDAIVGMTVGEKTVVTLAPEEAYGPIDPEAIRPAPKSAFGTDFEFVVGEVVQGNGPQGSFLAKIHEVQDDQVLLNLNHPLAGEQLTFEMKRLVTTSTKDTMRKAELYTCPVVWSPQSVNSLLTSIKMFLSVGFVIIGVVILGALFAVLVLLHNSSGGTQLRVGQTWKSF